jgi:hypothetical protein
MTRTIAALSGAALLALCAVSTRAENVPISGPTCLIINYSASAAHRAGFRKYLTRDEVGLLDRLKQSGALQSYEVLFRTFAQHDAWDAMVILDFPHYADVAYWGRIEQSAPGGLSPTGLALASPVATYSADQRWHEQVPAAIPPSTDPVYFVLEYKVKDPGRYETYVEDYVVPQFRGWMTEGILSEYSIYQSRYIVDGGWDSLIVLRYKDFEAFGRREQVVAKTRALLKSNPSWQAMQEIKQTIRTESATAIAAALTARPR